MGTIDLDDPHFRKRLSKISPSPSWRKKMNRHRLGNFDNSEDYTPDSSYLGSPELKSTRRMLVPNHGQGVNAHKDRLAQKFDDLQSKKDSIMSKNYNPFVSTH
jgi:hypothetical protein